MKKDLKKAGKEPVKIKEEPKQGVYEIENGYSLLANGQEKFFIGDKVIAFKNAVSEYKIIKGL